MILLICENRQGLDPSHQPISSLDNLQIVRLLLANRDIDSVNQQ